MKKSIFSSALGSLAARIGGLFISVLVLGASLTVAASAQTWPERPISVVVPYPAGGAIDASARRISDFLTAELGQPVVVENRQGANSVVGTTYVAQSAPDGYTFLYTTLVAQAGNLYDYPDLPYDTFESFTPVTAIQAPPNVLAARTGLEADTFEKLLELARQRPGEISFGTNGPGSPAHLRGVQVARSGNIDLNLIAYPGGAAAMAELAGGHLDLYPAQFSATTPFVKDGKVKILAALGPKRLEQIPDVPSITEFPGYENFNELATFPLILAPAGTPEEIVQRMYEAVAKIVKDNPKYRAMSEAAHEYPPFAATPAEAGEMLKSYVKLVGSLVN